MKKIEYVPNIAQNEAECRAFLQELLNQNVRSYLEIGVQRGLTFLSAALTMEPGARMIGVDMPGGPWGVKDGTGPQQIHANIERATVRGQHVTMFWGDSRDPEIIRKVSKARPYDLVFIDGDHRYEGVKADWENYGPMGRIVVFHDIVSRNRKKIEGEWVECGVARLWSEIKEEATRNGDRFVEFIDSWDDDHSMGIGMLWRD